MRVASASIAVLLTASGCASWFLHGGELVAAGYEPETVVVYDAEGAVPAGATYMLVRTSDGEDAIFECSSDGSGSLITNQWREGDEDHFFCWVGSGPGYEYVVPVDRSQPALRYVYPAGYFSVQDDDGVEKPVGVVDLEPVATLTPR